MDSNIQISVEFREDCLYDYYIMEQSLRNNRIYYEIDLQKNDYIKSNVDAPGSKTITNLQHDIFFMYIENAYQMYENKTRKLAQVKKTGFFKKILGVLA